MLAFYRDVLGLKLDQIRPHPRGGTVAFLSGSQGEAIELIRYTTPAPVRPEVRERVHTGIHHFGFQVDDIEAEYERLKGLDVEFDGDLRPQNLSGHAVLHFWDPEGNRLHLTQVKK
jgi:catechol 2,3-dioxygenase-like lactoylglutathione lyase family enzyme